MRKPIVQLLCLLAVHVIENETQNIKVKTQIHVHKLILIFIKDFIFHIIDLFLLSNQMPENTIEKDGKIIVDMFYILDM